MAGDTTATFTVKVPVETNASTAADSVTELRDAIDKSQNAVKQFSTAMRNLRGNSAEVKTAKQKLKAGIDAERGAISRNTLELLKQGKGLIASKKGTGEASNATSKLRDALKSAGGPVDSVVSKVESLTKGLSGSEAAMGLVAGGAALAVGAIVALGAAVAAATVSLASFILESGNALRTAGLFREAIVGSAADAGRMGDQIDLLATKVPTSRAELNRMYTDLRRNTDRTRISGQGILDVFNATAQASAAMGDSAGKALEGILTRGKQLGTFQLSFAPGGIDELQGLGIASEDVAKQLAENLKIGLDEARQLLATNRVKLDDGAKAVREVVEKRFGKVNAALMLDLNTQVQKFKDRLQGLVKDIKLDKILAGFDELSKMFDENTVTGQALKGIITDFGAVLEKVFVDGLPFIKELFAQMVLGALKIEIALLDVGLWLKKTFGIDFTKYALTANDAIAIVKTTLAILTPVVQLAALTIIFMVESFKAAVTGIELVYLGIKELWGLLSGLNFESIGASIIDGIVNGLKNGIAKIKNAVTGIGTSIKKTFEGALDIGSPSKVFEGYGEMSAEGYAKGISGGPATSAGMNVTLPPTANKSGTSTGPVSVTLNMNFPNAKDGDGVKQAMTSGSFKAELIRVFEEVFTNAGTPTQTAQAGAL